MMSTQEHGLAEQDFSSAAAKRSVSFGEFLLSLCVVLAAILLGVAGGIWLAERHQPAKEKDSVTPRASTQPIRLPAGEDSQRATTDQTTTQTSGNMTPASQPVTKTIRLGLPSIRAIQHSDHRDFTEIAIELRSVVLLRAAHLRDPERVYFDFARSGQARRVKGRLSSRSEVPVDDARVARVRIARWESGDVRVVFDLKRSCEYSYRLASDPSSRIIVELRALPQGALAYEAPTRAGTMSGTAALAATRR